jgi:hypothetical protein
MPNLKLQVSRALKVVPSFNTNIPMPNVIVSSATTGAAAGKLIDTSVNFSSVGVNPLNVKVGDTIYNFSTNTAAMVTKVDSATQLSVNGGIMSSFTSYTLYSGTNIAGSVEPCVLYVGVGGSLNVTTAGGDVVDFVGIASGTFLPVQVIRVNYVTAASDIIALW